MSDTVTYVHQSHVERIKGPLRHAYLPHVADPVKFGVHSEIAEHYGVDPDIHAPEATTLDYLISATGGWLTGTFGGALEARQIPAGEGVLAGAVRGEIDKIDKIVVITKIHVTMQLKGSAENQATAERVHGFYADYCPIYRSIKDSIEITTSLEYEITE